MTSLTQGQRIAKTLAPCEPAGEEAPPAAFLSLSERVLSFFVSVVVHSLLLLFLAIFVYGNRTEPAADESLESRVEVLPEQEAITEAEISVEEMLNASDEQDSSKVLKNVAQLANASAAPPVKVFVSTTNVAPVLSPQSGNGWGGDELAGLGEGAGSGKTAGNGNQEEGDGEVGFFGTKAKGKSFVFIVDCSGSMTTPTGMFVPRFQLPVTRFFRARQELYASLAQLSKNQAFYIIFYNHETFPMFFPRNAQALVPARPEFVGMARTWITKVEPGGGTDPREAFQLALALKPEVIFFLTDGAIPPATRLVAKQANKSRTIIHTIAFGILNHQDILKGIAADNGGRFRFVP